MLQNMPWRGVLAVLDATDAEGRRLVLSTGPDQQPNHVELPLPLYLPLSSWSQLIKGGQIERIWRDGNLIRAAGHMKLSEPRARPCVRWLQQRHRLGLDVMIDWVGAAGPERPGPRTIAIWRISGAALTYRPPWDEALLEAELPVDADDA
jgi:hypothetical protein